MRDDEFAVVEDVVADQSVEETRDPLRQLRRLARELFERFGQAVRDLHVASLELSHQLDVVIARNAERRFLGHHRHHEAKNVGHPRAAVDEVADEDGLPAGGVRRPIVRVALDPFDEVSELVEERAKLVEASVHVADDVERAVLVPAVVPERVALDDRRVDRLDRLEDVDVAESFALKPS